MKAIITFTLINLLLVPWLNLTGQESNTGNRNTNELKMEVSGGNQGFEDEAFIHFREGATTGYDPDFDAIKWFSPDPEATMIWTVASDGTNLAINKLPLEDLHSILNNIPLQFVCGYGGGEYTLTFSQLETFNENIEIWLEDLLIGGDWINITADEPVYVFNGIPDDTPDRFMIHIYDPTAVLHTDDINKKSSTVTMYAAGNKIYISKPETLQISDIHLYDLSGREVNYKIISTSGLLHMLQVNGHTGFYFVRILADHHLYTKKVLIVN